MKLSDLSDQEILRRLNFSGLGLQVTPFRCYVKSAIHSVAENIRLMYSDYQLIDIDTYADFHVSIAPPKNMRRWFKPQVLFNFDGRIPFLPLPIEQAYPIFEWGLNWCVSNHINTFLILHAAVLASEEYAFVLPGEPGAGKSTLTAALMHNGFRLLSDELTLINPGGEKVTPIPRPVSLKNQSIELIKTSFPSAILTEPAEDTAKGTVAHMRPSSLSLEHEILTASPRYIIFPRYQAEAKAQLKPLSKSESLIRLVEMAFNYSIIGMRAFRDLRKFVQHCDCYTFQYSKLDDAFNTFERLKTELN